MRTVRCSVGRTVKAAALALVLAFAVLFLAAALPANAQAATNAWPVITAYGDFETEYGAYKFYAGAENRLEWTTADDVYGTNYVQTDMPSGATFFKGSTAYYVHDVGLYSYNFKTAKASKLKKLDSSAVAVGAVWSSNVYVSYTSASKKKSWTRVFNVKTKKLGASVGDFKIVESSGSYAVGAGYYANDTAARTITLCKLTSKGLKKVKQLAKYGQAAAFAGGKLYYSKADNAKLNRVRFYRANADGSKATQIGTFGDKPSDHMLVHDITTTSCTVQNYSNYDCFQYIYKTGELIPY